MNRSDSIQKKNKMSKIISKIKRTDNSGSSLVEIIIAVTILSLVTIPTLHSITRAMVYNSKARQRQNVTVAAESVIETLKGYDMESLREAFSNGSIDGITTQGGSISCSPTVTEKDRLEDDTPVTFQINNMKTEEAANSRLVNMTIEAKPSLKSADIMELYNINTDYDMVFVSDRDIDHEAHDAAIDLFRANEMEAFLAVLNEKDERKKELQERDIDFSYLKLKEKETKFTLVNDGDNIRGMVSMSFTYGMVDYPYYTKKTGGTESSTESSTESTEDASDEEFTYEDSTDEVDEEDYMGNFVINDANKFSYPDTDDTELVYEVELPNYVSAQGDKDASLGYPFGTVKAASGSDNVKNKVFIFYYPKYKNEFGYADAHGNTRYIDSEIKDKIIIDNQCGTSADCYLIKQRPDESVVSKSRLIIFEGSYNAEVKGSGGLRLFHNMGTNLGKEEKEDDTKFIIKSTFPNGVYDFVGKDKADSDVEKELKKELRANKILVYDLNVKVFEANSDGTDGKMLAEFEASMNEKKLNYQP